MTATKRAGSSRNSRMTVFNAIIDSASRALSASGRLIRTTRVRSMRSVSMAISAHHFLLFQFVIGVPGDAEQSGTDVSAVSAENRCRGAKVPRCRGEPVGAAVVDRSPHHRMVESHPVLPRPQLFVTQQVVGVLDGRGRDPPTGQRGGQLRG